MCMPPIIKLMQKHKVNQQLFIYRSSNTRPSFYYPVYLDLCISYITLYSIDLVVGSVYLPLDLGHAMCKIQIYYTSVIRWCSNEISDVRGVVSHICRQIALWTWVDRSFDVLEGIHNNINKSYAVLIG